MGSMAAITGWDGAEVPGKIFRCNPYSGVITRVFALLWGKSYPTLWVFSVFAVWVSIRLLFSVYSRERHGL